MREREEKNTINEKKTQNQTSKHEDGIKCICIICVCLSG